MAAQLVRHVILVSIERERIRTTLIPNGITNRLVNPMDEGETNNPIDAAAEITDAMMSSLADVVKNVISSPENGENDVPEEGSNVEEVADNEQ